MKLSFRKISVEDAEMIRNWIKFNEFTRHWYYFDKTPRLATIKNKIEKKYTEPRTKAMIRKITVLSNKEIAIEFECGITVRETL